MEASDIAIDAGEALAAPANRARTWVATLNPALVLAGIVAAGAVLRFATLSTQSYWFDESATVHLLRMPFVPMLHGIANGESTPPLYYVLARLWTLIFGDSEAGLRSLSALVGVATVPVAAAIGRRIAGWPAALAAATLTALSPALIWYSQEARSYALLTFLSALSLLFFLRLRDGQRRADVVGWAVASALALTAHYFAGFLVFPELAWVLARHRSRVTLAATALIGATAVALAPLLLHQQHKGLANWITSQPRTVRLRGVLAFFTTGVNFLTVQAGWLLPLLVAVGVAAFGLARADSEQRRRVGVLLALGGGVIAIPFVLAHLGKDYVLDRNLLPAWVPLFAALAVGVTRARPRALAAVALVALCAVFVSYDVRAHSNSLFQRDDWRGVAQTLGPARAERVVVVAPGWQVSALDLYVKGLQPMKTPVKVTEADVVSYDGFVPAGARREIPVLGHGFRPVGYWRVQRMSVTRFRAARPTSLAPGALSGSATAAAILRPGAYVQAAG